LLFHKKLELAELVLFDIQQVVLREVQLVYKGQGVQIADKHIEIILRDLTSRIRIIECGNTNFLPGELIYPNQLKLLSNLLPSAALEGIEIMPVFIGLSGCGRGSSSFIAASSFQNTRKVLSAAVINHSSDWLRGLKSHVIIGSRIPAGTGTPFSLDIPLCSDLAQTQWYTTQIDLKSLEFNLKKRIKRM
jgi:DNA-directed RNA polymerase subunit beta'